MKVSVITPTGGRPIAFELCELWMSRQTKQPDEWIVVDDFPIATKCTRNQHVIRRTPFWSPNSGHTLQLNLIEAFKIVTGDIILIMEDDDWYSPFYIENMVKKFLTLNSEGSAHHLIGAAIYPYFNIDNFTYHIHNNIHHSSLSQVCFTKRLLPQMEVLLNYFKHAHFFDLELWGYARCNKTMFLTKTEWCVGIKGLPGRPGVMDEHRKPLPFPDPKFLQLEKWIGKEDVEIYKNYIKYEK
jgi:hypothetical protein